MRRRQFGEIQLPDAGGFAHPIAAIRIVEMEFI
jgi:hypothetical protein